MTAKQQILPVKAMILDMDGVLWRDEQAIGDLPYIFSMIQSKSIRVILATNNAARSPKQYIEKLRSFGVGLEDWQVINSSQATAHYLRQRYPDGGPVYIIGENGLLSALADQGFYSTEEDIDDILAVIVGLDHSINYKKLERATLLIRSGVPFIATNPDRTFPTPRGLVPGAGAILAAIEAATDVQALVIGKPAPEMYRMALERLGIPANETLVVGDRLETDIAGGQALGCPTALVLTGVTSEEKALEWMPKPEWIVKDLTAIVESL